MVDPTKSWFLSKLPAFSSDLHEVIQDAHALLMNSKPLTFAISSPSSKLKGFATISMNTITKGELTLNSPKYNRGHQVKLTIDHHLKLPQITITKNCLEKCLNLLKGMDISDLSNVLGVVDHILALIQQARSTLAEPDRKSIFPLAFRSVFTESPVDCAADFFIQSPQLVTMIHCLSFADNAFEQALSHLKSLQTVKLEDKTCQIVDKVVVETTVPHLVELQQHFGRIEAFCLDFGRKASYFEI